ncbi:MAG: Gfo/Idh/MocA family oxidoreductase [Gaiellaceae bacterium MAG52_C11]|nr:Gfo/Idh/MocA family oxidoreductase [Candidatus Gaiellasilicea maunaloa]
MRDRVRIGLIGAGWIAGRHLASLGGISEAEVVAVCDIDEERAHQALPSPAARAYGAWWELLERESLDAVFICTPPLAHRDPAVAALKLGLGVFLEKPIGRTIEDAAAIVAAAARSGSACAIGYQWRGLAPLDDLRSALEGQTLGLLVGYSFGPPIPSRPWFFDRRKSGGNILERASHHVDLQRAIGGEILSVQAAAGRASLGHEHNGESGDVEEVVSLILHFASGALGAVHVASTRSGFPEMHGADFIAGQASFHLDLDPSFVLTGRMGDRTIEVASRQDPFERSVARFVETVLTRDPGAVFCSPVDALETLKVTLACERALETGETVVVRELFCG